jgi:hypothetical protein
MQNFLTLTCMPDLQEKRTHCQDTKSIKIMAYLPQKGSGGGGNVELKHSAFLHSYLSEVVSSEVATITKRFVFLPARVFPKMSPYICVCIQKLYSNVSCILKHIYKWWHIVLILLQSAFFTQHFVFEHYPC